MYREVFVITPERSLQAPSIARRIVYHREVIVISNTLMNPLICDVRISDQKPVDVDKKSIQNLVTICQQKACKTC